MIAIVDDDPSALSFLEEVLAGAGYRVVAYGGGEAALRGIEAARPDLVISDVVMPGMSGLELRRTCGARFPGARTPFVFLSSLSDPADVVRGLDAGADDYLVKPVQPDVLLAKVRAHLRRSAAATPRFTGDLARFPFAKIVEFCELQGVTGEVEVASGGWRAVVRFRGGVPVAEGEADGEAIARALELAGGTFVIRTHPVDFGAIAPAALPEPGEAPLDPAVRPAGRLSAVTVGDRLVQLQTEYVTTPAPAVVSVAIRNGRTLLKRTVRASGSREAVEALIEERHGDLEREVRSKLAELAASRAAAAGGDASGAAAPAAQAGAEELFEAGLEAFLAGDHAKALELFERAHAIDPENRAVEVNLAVVRKKLGIG